ncbi:DUF5131 family protein [Rhizorhapis sp.]|uniref:DUF5131 family protein n=1 Tax=Rhizorhapis sp. TaxID=1968842 RepID=UPI002B464B72|nr:DUF5131 family protein [Rhizorhapis sp.]HKR17622.1 DUF5131 family protein [Rhizorhapis sp.]
MGDVTKIEWADATFNPWIGCTEVSPACDNCYARGMMDERYRRVTWGPGEDRVRTSKRNWAKPRKWNREAAITGMRPFVFCASLADVFDNEVDPAWRYDLMQLIETTPNLVWLLLTKRIGNVIRMTDAMHGHRPLPCNVAIGATMANQFEYDRDRRKLAELKQQRGPLFTFGSFEPLLGLILMDNSAPDWIIVGGESGKSARPMNLDWARSMRDQSHRLGRIFNFKQVGGRGADKGGHELDGRTHFDRPAVPMLATQ